MQKITPFFPRKPPCHLSGSSESVPTSEHSQVSGSMRSTDAASPGTAYNAPSGASTAPCHLFLMFGPSWPFPMTVTSSVSPSMRSTQSVSEGMPNTFPFKSTAPPPHLYFPSNSGPISSVVPFKQSIFSTRGAWLGNA